MKSKVKIIKKQDKILKKINLFLEDNKKDNQAQNFLNNEIDQEIKNKGIKENKETKENKNTKMHKNRNKKHKNS